MPKRLLISPELLLLAPLPSHRRGVGEAVRRLLARHGELPVMASADVPPGEVQVVNEKNVAVERVQFQIEDWHIPDDEPRNWRMRA